MDSTTHLAEFSSEAALPLARDEARLAGKRGLVDTFAVATAATTSAGYAILRDWSLVEGAPGEAMCWHDGVRVSAGTAALLNGTAAHLLDYDDVSIVGRTHPSAVLWSAVLALGQTERVSGAEALDAYEVGMIVTRALAAKLPKEPHYAKGWHTTSTVGRLSAVCALARLVHLSTEQTARALGLVASLAAGSQANFGTHTKPLHAGVAARDAVMAVQLVQRGFTANPAQLDEPRAGFFAMYEGDTAADPQVLGDALEHWARHWPEEITVKRFPSCFGTHRGIAGALQLRSAGLASRDVASVRVTVHSRGLGPLITHAARTGDEGRFSLPYAVAAALIDGSVGFSTFTDEAVARPDVQALAASVSTLEAERPPIGRDSWADGYAVVQATLDDGSVREVRVDAAPGQAENALTIEQLEDKLRDCSVRGEATWSADQALDVLWALDQQPVVDFSFITG